MTRITKLVVHGFKSFANRTEIPFGGSDYNVILGPNGSGKSNVLDAICFVLGKSSKKELRTEKSAHLIYNGGKSKVPASKGEVSIYFENSKKEFPLDTEEVRVGRIVKQNGQSVYKINSQTRTRAEVLELLARARIDPDGYNIILQGDIVRFTEMPSIERRQIIEEIAGISMYEDRKLKALSELSNVEGKIKDAELILNERNTYLKSLKGERDQALKYKEMNDQIRSHEASLLKIRIDSDENQRGIVEKSEASLRKRLDSINDMIAQKKKSDDQKKEEVSSISSEIEEKGEIEQIRISKEIEAMKIQMAKVQMRIDSVRAEASKIRKREEDLKKDLDEAAGKIKELNEHKADLEKQSSGAEKEKELIGQKIAKFKEKNKMESEGSIEKEIEETEKKSEVLQQKLNEMKEKEHSLLRQKDGLEREYQSFEERMQKVEQLKKENREKMNALEAKRSEFKKATLELNKCLDSDSLLASQIGSNRERLFRTTEELAKLKAKSITARDFASSEIAVRKVLEQKGKIPGIYGTVAELGNVEKKFSVSLEVAAGPRLHSVVVEDDKVAADAIQFLKKNKFGTATFLPLNKIRPPEERVKKQKEKGVLGHALDLVTYDPKYRKVFEYVFANTLVVDTIATARNIGIGTAKMVSLDGDIAELSGLMRGGFRLKRKEGGFSEKESENLILERERSIADFQNTLKVLEKQRRENEERITALRQLKATLEGHIIKEEKSMYLEHEDMDVSDKKIEELKKSIADAEKSLDSLRGQSSSVHAELMQLKVKRSELRTRIGMLRDPVLIAELQAFEDRKNQISEMLLLNANEAKNIENSVSSVYIPEQTKIQNVMKQLAKDERGFNEEEKNLKIQYKKDEDALRQKEKAATEFSKRFRQLFERRKKIENEIHADEVEIAKYLEQSRDQEIKLNTHTLKLVEIKAKLKDLQHQFERYHGVEIDTKKSEEELQKEIEKFQRMQQQIGMVNMRALEIYDAAEAEYQSLIEKKNTLASEKEDVHRLIEEIEQKKSDLLMRTFDSVNDHFQRIFKQLSVVGDAHLELEDPKNPFEGGVQIRVRLSQNKYLEIRGLSGGEKTMTALALIFAIQEHDPASFYVFDEVDASLDKKNSEMFAKLIRAYSKRAQYVIISHNDYVISEGSHLFGVSKDEHGITNVVSLKI